MNCVSNNGEVAKVPAGVPAGGFRADEDLRQRVGVGTGAGIRRKWLYKWSEKERALYTAATSTAAGVEPGPVAARPTAAPDTQLRKRVQELESMVARQSLEIDFLKGALQRIEQRRRKRAETTASASTSKSEA
jgi:hypothetical protein